MKISKKEALEQMSLLEEQMKVLRNIIEQPERDSLIALNEQAWRLDGSPSMWGRFIAGSFTLGIRDPNYRGALFESETQANEYGQALVTLCHLRRMPGTVAAGDDDGSSEYWSIVLRKCDSGIYYVEADFWMSASTMWSQISPCFKTKKAAQRAIAVIGEVLLTNMFKTLHGL